MKRGALKLLSLTLLNMSGAVSSYAQVTETYAFEAWAGGQNLGNLTLGSAVYTNSIGNTVRLVGDGVFNGHSLNCRIAAEGDDDISGNKGLLPAKNRGMSILGLYKDDVVVINGGCEQGLNSTDMAEVASDGTVYTYTMLADGSLDYKLTASKNNRIYTITVNSKYITLGPTGYATFCHQNEENVKFPEGLKAYAVTGIDGDKVVLSRIKVLKRGVGVILIGAPDTRYEVALTEEKSTGVANNLMVAASAVDGVQATSSDYVLADGALGVGFYKSSGNGYISQGKAYLAMPPAQAQALRIVLDETTGISDAAAPKDGNSSVFNVQGQRLDRFGVGSEHIVIRNGRKFIK